MRSGAVSDQPMLELLCGLAAQRANGMLELTTGKRRRTFWFEGGAVTASKSNLKSESLKGLQERMPDTETSELIALQGTLRVRNTLTMDDGEWTFTPNEPPPARRPIDLLNACWVSMIETVSDTDLRTRFAGLMGRFPRLSGTGGVAASDLPFGPPLSDFITQLDGQRPLQDVIDFAPVPPDNALRALYLALACGVVDIIDQASTAQITAARGAASDPASSTADDLIQDLFAEELGAPDPATSTLLDDRPRPEDPTDQALGGFVADMLDTIAPDEPVPAAVLNDAPEDTAEAVDPELVRLREELARVNAAENDFEVLSIAWDASDSAYRKAYFKLAQELHPDRWASHSADAADLASEIFARVSAAWDNLGDAETRQATIDRVIHGIKSEDELAMEKVQDILAAENAFKAGMVEFQAGRIVQAHEHFERAFERVPEEHEYKAFYGYTTFKLNAGRDDDAAERGERMLRDAVDTGTKLHNGWMLVGMIYRERGELEIAMKALLTSLKLKPDNVQAQRELRRIKHLRDKEKEKEKGGLSGFLSGLFGRKK
ncbi:MAG: DnaJ domain-containing protein [Alphaproteobacteria bacterium]|nr:DnaJ domain-containing protein [Alphaproteobacteria bacterium]